MSQEEEDPVEGMMGVSVADLFAEPDKNTTVNQAIVLSQGWLTGDTGIADVETSLNTILGDHQTRLKVLMVALARRRAEDLINLDGITRRIESVLSNDKFLSFLIAQQPGDLVKLYNSLKGRQERAIQFIWKVLEGGFPNRLEDQDAHTDRIKERLREKGIDPETLSPAKREKIRGLLESIEKTVQDGED